MKQPVVFFVGSDSEVAHHAAPLQSFGNVQVAEPDQVLQTAKPGDLAIFFSEHFDRFRHTCDQLKQQHVATLYLIDGILEWRNSWENATDEVACPFTMRPVLSHKVACIGDSQARVLNSWGNGRKTEVIGIPRLDALRNQWVSLQPSASHPAGEPASLSPRPFRLLVMTAKTPAFTDSQRAAVWRSLSDVKSWAQSDPQVDQRPVEVIWRLTQELDQQLQVHNELSDLTGMELHRLLDQVDAVLTTPSTAMLEGMLAGRPVGLLDYHHSPHYVQSGWDISTGEHLAPAIEDMARQTERRMLFQREQLIDSLQLAEPASERLWRLIEHMLKLSAQQLQQGVGKDGLQFPPNLLQPPAGIATEFSHARLFPGTDFDNPDQVQLQAQLGHARREIDHLHREIDQLRSELDQAHQIFETINRHPIAGPIVRIRQKMLDLMAAIQQRNRDTKNDEPKNRQCAEAVKPPPAGLPSSESLPADSSHTSNPTFEEQR